jgi:predicted transcriptional regulator
MSSPVVSVTLRVPPHLAEQLDHEAKRRRLSKNAFAVQAIEVGLRVLLISDNNGEGQGRAS